MTRNGAVSENLATGEVEHISSREPETELSASSEESADAAADLALYARRSTMRRKAHERRKKADTQAVRDGSAARQLPSSACNLPRKNVPIRTWKVHRPFRPCGGQAGRGKAAIPTKKVLLVVPSVFLTRRPGKGKTQLHFWKKWRNAPMDACGTIRFPGRSMEIVHAAHAKVHEVEQENVGVEAGAQGRGADGTRAHLRKRQSPCSRPPSPHKALA